MHAWANLARRDGGRTLLVALAVTVSLGMAAHGLATATHEARTIDHSPVHGPMHGGSDIISMLSALCIATVFAVAAFRRPDLRPTLPILALRGASAMPVLVAHRPMSVHPPPDAGPFLRS